MASGEITVNFSIDSTYAEGLDKAVACDEPVLFCIIVDSTVYDDNGVLSGSSCHTAFRLFHGDSTEVFERGRGNCGDDIYLGRDPMAAGPYRLELDIEMDDGTTGSAVYNFTMLAE